MNNLILVRHGQSLWNEQKKFTGFMDVGLSEQGKSEANLSGKLIKELNIEFHSHFTSKLKRAVDSLNIILKILNKSNNQITQAWELNERHYGGLTGLNKDDTIKKFGEKQVQLWRRSFDTRPPPMGKGHPYKDKINSDILSESLEDTVNRVVPYYEKNIEPLVSLGKNILIVFHGNSCRAMLMKLFNISKEKIIQFEIPTGNPLLIKFDNKKKIQNYKYLDPKREKKILFNV